MLKLANKIAVVTGASRGLGEGIARALAANGATLVLTARSASGLERVVGEIRAVGGVADFVVADVTVESEVAELFRRVDQLHGRIDLLINNAGIAISGHIDELSFSDWQRVLAVNINGMFLCSRAAAARMKSQRLGRIINIGSISGQMPRVKSTPYTTSKFAVTGFTKALALELRPFHIAVSCIHPGNVMTDIWASSPQVAEREGVMAVSDVAEVVVAMASLPDAVNLYEAVMLPVSQPYLGRG